jgi:3-deoxy-D-manno-octulosonic-acid transferase
VRTEADARRFAAFGVPPDRIDIAGDMKFDAPLLPRSAGRVSELRRQLGIADDEFLIVAGSTRPGEEADLLRVYRNLCAGRSDIHLLLAPRHIERAGEIRLLLEQMDIPYSVYGRPRKAPGASVILCDRMGLLQELYLAADLAFVGGTLVDIGGHNVLEPVWAGAPVVYGPHTDNVREAVDYIESHGFGRSVPTADELAEVVQAMCEGSLTFARKRETYDSDSATSRIGTYLLNCLRDA